MPAIPSSILTDAGRVAARDISSGIGGSNSRQPVGVASDAPVVARTAAFDADKPRDILDYVDELLEREAKPQYSSSGGSSSASSSPSDSSSSSSSSSSSDDSSSQSSYPSSTSVSDSCEGWVVCRPDGYLSSSGSSISVPSSSSGDSGNSGSSSSSSNSNGSGSSSSSGPSSSGPKPNAGVRSGVSGIGLLVAVLATSSMLA